MQIRKLYLGLCLLITHNAFTQSTFSGKITDAVSGDALPGAGVYFPDLKTGTVTDMNGYYIIRDLPAKNLTVQVSFIGYAAITSTIDLTENVKQDFALNPSVTEIKELVITGLSQSAEADHIPTPVSIVTKTELLQNASGNIIDALSSLPGISQISTGPAISKPEIRGLGYNRVVVVNDGIKQEGQQWGDEHGIEIDEYSVNRVEILKGPAGIAYGSDALAGVINFISAPALPSGTVKGNLLSNYQTNNGLAGYSANIAGNINGYMWDARYSGKYAHAYQNKYDGYVYGSSFNEQSAALIAGVNKKWGYSHLHAGTYILHTGIVEGERDSTGSFLMPVALNDSTVDEIAVSASDQDSYVVGLPRQTIKHYKAVLNNSFVVGQGALNIIAGWQQNNRQEFEDVLHPDDYALYFKMNTFNYDLRYLFPEKNNWQSSAGVNGMRQISRNLGEEVLIPEYDLLDIGVFITSKKTLNKLDISAGMRYDSRLLDSYAFYASDDNAEIFAPLHRTFSAFSGSAGAAYQFTDIFYGKLNISRGFRAPNMAELSANGVHEGTFRYEKGNAALMPETSLQLDAAAGCDAEHISFEIDAFHNHVNDFIYLQKLNSVSGGDSLLPADDGSDYAVFTYAQGDANLTGGELILDIHPHPLDWLHFENSFSFVIAKQENATDSTEYLPFSPAPKLVHELRADFKNVRTTFTNSYIKFSAENYFRQQNIYAAYNTETETPGYILFNAGLGSDVMLKKKVIFSFYISAENIADKAYQSHLSRLKYAGDDPVTGRSGVYNEGRNISFKISVPLYLKNP